MAPSIPTLTSSGSKEVIAEPSATAEWDKYRSKILSVGKVAAAFRLEPNSGQQFTSFLPRMLHQQLISESVNDGGLELSFDGVGRSVEAAVMFSDASGFTQVTHLSRPKNQRAPSRAAHAHGVAPLPLARQHAPAARSRSPSAPVCAASRLIAPWLRAVMRAVRRVHLRRRGEGSLGSLVGATQNILHHRLGAVTDEHGVVDVVQAGVFPGVFHSWPAQLHTNQLVATQRWREQ